MTAREVLVSRSVIESLAFDHGLVIEIDTETGRAYCTHRGVTMFAPLRPVAGAS